MPRRRRAPTRRGCARSARRTARSTGSRRSGAALEQAGFGVLLPSWWTGKGTRLRLGVRAQVRSPKMKESGAGVGLEELVHVDWQIALGDETLTLEELQALARVKEPLVRVRG